VSTPTTTPTDGETDDQPDAETLAAEVEILREENQRLREEYARARRSEYRRTAAVLIVAGLLAIGGGVVVSSSRTVLFALGGTGVFIGALTYYLTPERMLPATVGEDVYGALADTQESIVEELGLQDDRLYVPTDDGVRLFVPQSAEYSVPEDGALTDVFVVGADDQSRGIAVSPTGNRLFERFEEGRTDRNADDPVAVAEQLAAALVEQFELLGGTEVERDGERVTVAVSDSAYGPVDRFDHPVVSLLASGLARELDRPVSVEVDRPEDGPADALVTCRWE